MTMHHIVTDGWSMGIWWLIWVSCIAAPVERDAPAVAGVAGAVRRLRASGNGELLIGCGAGHRAGLLARTAGRGAGGGVAHGSAPAGGADLCRGDARVRDPGTGDRPAERTGSARRTPRCL